MSTIDKKKISSSSKHSMKEHHDEKTDDNNREKKNIDEIPIEEVFRKKNQIIISIWKYFILYRSSRKRSFLF